MSEDVMIRQIAEAFAKEGMGAVAIAAGIWLLWYLVKHTVTRMGKILDGLSDKLQTFASFVRQEHERQIKNQEEIFEQHKEITDILKSINNRTERLNK